MFLVRLVSIVGSDIQMEMVCCITSSTGGSTRTTARKQVGVAPFFLVEVLASTKIDFVVGALLLLVDNGDGIIDSHSNRIFIDKHQ